MLNGLGFFKNRRKLPAEPHTVLIKTIPFADFIAVGILNFKR
jgi:hypothetical protein